MNEILLRDETATGGVINTISLTVGLREITVRDLIIARVTKEVNEYNERREGNFRGLVEPAELKGRLNPKPGQRTLNPVDAEKQCYVALDGFQRNSFFVLVNDRQAESLDEVIHLRDQLVVSFVRLTPLVGG